MSFTGSVPSYGFAGLLLFFAGLSHACYHATAPAMIARVSGERMGAGMSFFMTGGELGRAFGPILIVLLVGWVGLEQCYLAAIPGVLCSLLLARQVGRVDRAVRPSERVSLRPIFRERRVPLLLLLAFVWIRALMVGSLGVFTPIYLTTRDLSLTQAAAGYALLELAGAAGAMGGGTLSDRLGRRRTLILLQVLAVPSFYAMAFGPHALIFPFLALTGLVFLSATPVVVAMCQEWLPESRSLASGLYFGLNYVATGAAAVLFGVVADQVGVRLAFHLLGLVPLVCIPLSFLLRDPPSIVSAGTH
jgi:FSR family fosmidomycin resistance protein-like MFS transporter